MARYGSKIVLVLLAMVIGSTGSAWPQAMITQDLADAFDGDVVDQRRSWT